MSGEFLPIQLIYKGKTERCDPKFNFPASFNVTQSPNHWSNEDKAKEILHKVIIPYERNKRSELGLRKNQPWLLIADVFKAHLTEPVKKIVAEESGKMIPVPNNLTHKFQPLDLTVNRSCKSYLRKQS